MGSSSWTGFAPPLLAAPRERGPLGAFKAFGTSGCCVRGLALLLALKLDGAGVCRTGPPGVLAMPNSFHGHASTLMINAASKGLVSSVVF